MNVKQISAFFAMVWIGVCLQAQPITAVAGFGTNPGKLNMYNYVPSGITGPGALVIALHGCTQTATEYAAQTGWNKLANLHKFYMVYAEQVSANNSSLCFNWFDTTQVNKNVGEDLSVKQMKDYMVAHYQIDTTRIFVTGLSAGAAMTVVMLATYPQTFSKGAVMAGLPYKASTSAFTAYNAMNGYVINTPAVWGNLVRAQNPGFKGSFPHVAIFQGTADVTVSPVNSTELIKQWTNLNHADQTVDSVYNSFTGNSNIQQNIYNDSLNNPVVYDYKITGMPHGIAVDTGKCPRQGGATATYALEEAKFHSTYWAAVFFGLIPNAYAITGAISVIQHATNEVYSVPMNSGSTYSWTVPKTAVIISGQGTNSITVDMGTISGNITVTETTTAGCINDEAKLYVTVTAPTGVAKAQNEAAKLYYSADENCLYLFNFNPVDLKSVELFDIAGQKVSVTTCVTGNKINLSNSLPAGLYIVRMNELSRQDIFKIVVSR